MFKKCLPKNHFRFSGLLFQPILKALLYNLHHDIAYIVAFSKHFQNIYDSTNDIRVIKSI